MKNKIIFVSVLTLLLSSGFFFNKLYYEASTASTVNFDSIKNVTDMTAEPSSDGTIILSSVYTPADIQRAIKSNTTYVSSAESRPAVLGGADKAIIDEIKNKAIIEANRVGANKAIENLTNKQEVQKFNDTIIRIDGLESTTDFPHYGPEDPGIIPPERIPEQFEFDTSIDPGEYNFFYTIYDKIQNVYGQRFDIRKIRISNNPSGGASFYIPATCEIKFNSANGSLLGSPSLVIHELTHAFHGDYLGPSPLWEEGMATVISEILDSGNTDDLLSRSEYTNLSFINDEFIDPYSWGAMTFYQLYIADKEYFIKYNKLYYQNKIRTNLDSIITTATVTPYVENELTLIWFSHQYAFIPSNQLSSEYAYVESSNLISDHFNLIIGATDNVTSINVKVYDNLNNLFFSFNTSESLSGYSNKYYHVSESDVTGLINFNKLINYNGNLKIVLMANNNEGKKVIQYLPKIKNYDPNASIIGSVMGPGDSVSVVNLDTNKSTLANISNGIFLVTNPEFKIQGRYRADVYQNQSYGCIGAFVDRSAAAPSLAMTSATKCIYTKKVKIASHFINKNYTTGAYRTIIQTSENKCKLQITGTSAFNNSIKISTHTEDFCGQVISINGVPVRRDWGTNSAFDILNLEKNVKYQYKLNYTDFVRQYSKTGSITTLNNPELIITDIKNTGDPSQQNFVRTYSFNLPISPESINNVSLHQYDEMWSSDPDGVEKNIVGQTLNISTPFIYNNADYYVEGLEKITNLSGNPIVGLKYGDSIFHTPLSPGTLAPGYEIAKTTLSENEEITLTTNFLSKNLTSEKVLLFKNRPNKECVAREDGSYDLECFKSLTETTINSNTIKTRLKESMLYNSNYYIQILPLVDDKNNYVKSTAFPLLSDPVLGTEIPKIVNYSPIYEGGKFIKLTIEFNNEISLDSIGELIFTTPVGLLRSSDMTITVNSKTLVLVPKTPFSNQGYFGIQFDDLKDIYGNYLTNCYIDFNNL